MTDPVSDLLDELVSHRVLTVLTILKHEVPGIIEAAKQGDFEAMKRASVIDTVSKAFLVNKYQCVLCDEAMLPGNTGAILVFGKTLLPGDKGVFTLVCEPCCQSRGPGQFKADVMAKIGARSISTEVGHA
jgi:hypothetical protein